MYICAEEIQATEKKIKDYFLRLKKIEFYQGSIKSTEESLKRVKQNIEKSNIVFYTSYSSIDYSADKVQGSPSIYNGIEKEIESAFHKLEEQERKLSERLIELQTNIDSLKLKNEEIGYILNLLDEESKQLIGLKYKDNKSFESISFQLKSSESSIRRKKDQILQDISRWFKVVC